MHLLPHAFAHDPQSAIVLSAAARIPAIIEQAVLARRLVMDDVSMLARDRAVDGSILHKREIVAAGQTLGLVNILQPADVGARLQQRDFRSICDACGHHQARRFTIPRRLFGGRTFLGQRLHIKPAGRIAGQCFRGAYFDAQLGRESAGLLRKVAAKLLFEKLAKEIAFVDSGVAFGHANAQSHDVIRKQRVTSRTLDLFANLVQHSNADLGDLRRVADRLRHRAERLLEDASPKSLDDLRYLHFPPPPFPDEMIPSSTAASTTARAMGAATDAPYPPCSTTTAKAMRRERSPS